MPILANPHHSLFFPLRTLTPKPDKPHFTSPKSLNSQNTPDEEGIPNDEVKLLAKFKSRHNFIRVVEVSRRADHPFAGARLLLLDAPGNIHSISFPTRRRHIITSATYYDVFAALPPVLPPGPIALFGLGAGSAARGVLRLYPETVLHGWEIDPAVIGVAREYFGLDRLERDFSGRFFVHVGDALKVEISGRFAGILVDLFSKGSLLPELQEDDTWRALRRCLIKGGRVMVNVGGSCVEAEEPGRSGKVVMDETLAAMRRVFGDDLFVLRLGNGKDDSSVALTGEFPDLGLWKGKLPRSLTGYVDMWTPFRG